MNKNKIAGYFFIIFGLIFISLPDAMTGAAIGTNTFKGAKIILGLIFIAGGISLIVSKLEEITIYFKKSGKGEEAHLIDPTLTLGNYDMTLDEFRRGIKEIADNADLMKIARETYVPQLEEFGVYKKELADKFLEVLGRARKNEPYQLPKEERREIINAFTQLKGNINPQQKEIFNRYGITMERGTKHNKIRLGGDFLTLSAGTHENPRTGQNFAHDLIKLIEKHCKS